MGDNMIIGSHVSFGKDQLKGSVLEAISYGANTFMFYTGAPQNTLRVAIDNNKTMEALNIMKEYNIDINNVICHAPYIVNPATKEIDKQEFAVNFIRGEIERCNTLGIKRIVLHPGSAVGVDRSIALNNISNVLNRVLDNDMDVVILIETMAGKGNECGKTIDEIKTIIDNVKYQDKIGVCLDTCHLNDSGIDINNIDSYLDEFDEKIGINKIGCVHVNDSKNPLSSHKDRHANIGFGTIGFIPLLNVINNPRLKHLPFILETPYIGDNDLDDKRLYPPFKYEINMIRSGVFNNNLMDDIRKEYK